MIYDNNLDKTFNRCYYKISDVLINFRSCHATFIEMSSLKELFVVWAIITYTFFEVIKSIHQFYSAS